MMEGAMVPAAGWVSVWLASAREQCAGTWGR